MRTATFAATQFACSWDKRANVAKADIVANQGDFKFADAVA